MSEKTKRKVYTYNLHLGVANYNLYAENDRKESEHYSSAGAIIFAAFALEAFLNHIGEQLFESWQDYLKKALSTEAKLALICEKLEIEIDFGVRPFQGLRALFRFRNAMAHSVTESLDPEKAKHYLEVGEGSWPAAEWEKMCNFKLAKDLCA